MRSFYERIICVTVKFKFCRKQKSKPFYHRHNNGIMKIIYENSQIKQTICWHTTQRRDISNCTEYLIFCIHIFLSYNHPENCSAHVLYALYIYVYMCICFYSGLSCDVRDCLFVLCIICLFNKCKKWQQTCFCC
jgi:hypothetical protein